MDGFIDLPQPTKMGSVASPGRYDAALKIALPSRNRSAAIR
jgi:hypothetical protein